MTKLLLCLLFCSGCASSNIDFNRQGAKNLFSHLSSRELIDVAKDNLDDRFSEDYNMSLEEYMTERIRLHRIKRRRTDESYVFKLGRFALTDEGKISIKVDKDENDDTRPLYNKERYIKIKTALHPTGTCKAELELYDFELGAKFTDSEITAGITWKFDF